MLEASARLLGLELDHSLSRKVGTLEIGKGEIVKWIIADKGHLILARSSAPPNPVRVKKTPPQC